MFLFGACGCAVRAVRYVEQISAQWRGKGVRQRVGSPVFADVFE